MKLCFLIQGLPNEDDALLDTLQHDVEYKFVIDNDLSVLKVKQFVVSAYWINKFQKVQNSVLECKICLVISLYFWSYNHKASQIYPVTGLNFPPKFLRMESVPRKHVIQYLTVLVQWTDSKGFPLQGAMFALF